MGRVVYPPQLFAVVAAEVAQLFEGCCGNDGGLRGEAGQSRFRRRRWELTAPSFRRHRRWFRCFMKSLNWVFSGGFRFLNVHFNFDYRRLDAFRCLEWVRVRLIWGKYRLGARLVAVRLFDCVSVRTLVGIDVLQASASFFLWRRSRLVDLRKRRTFLNLYFVNGVVQTKNRLWEYGISDLSCNMLKMLDTPVMSPCEMNEPTILR